MLLEKFIIIFVAVLQNVYFHVPSFQMKHASFMHALLQLDADNLEYFVSDMCTQINLVFS
jgi:hypothetical protein